MWLEAHLWVPSRVKHEGSLLCGGVYVIVVLEIHQWKEFVSVILPLVDKEVEILFQLLVDPFHLSVTLWMCNVFTLLLRFSQFTKRTGTRYISMVFFK